MQVWDRKENGTLYEVVEVSFDGDLHEFQVTAIEWDGDKYDDNNTIATIRPVDVDGVASIIGDLDDGKGVDGWEDGKGNTITI